MKSSFLVFALLFAGCGCGHTPGSARLPRTPPTVGFFALVRPSRTVRCVIDKDMTIEMCGEVAKACDKINAAVGFELLTAPKLALPETIISSKAADEVTYVYVDHTETVTGESGALGVTVPGQYEVSTGYLRRVIVVLAPEIWSGREQFEAVVLHELFHSVGAGHATQDSPFSSVIRPSWEPGTPTELTPGDVAALRAAYPR